MSLMEGDGLSCVFRLDRVGGAVLSWDWDAVAGPVACSLAFRAVGAELAVAAAI